MSAEQARALVQRARRGYQTLSLVAVRIGFFTTLWSEERHSGGWPGSESARTVGGIGPGSAS
jgi:hypothetical protein